MLNNNCCYFFQVQGSRVTPVLGVASIVKMGDNNKRMMAIIYMMIMIIMMNILIIFIVPRFSQETACPYQSQHCLKVADFEGDDSRINLENPQKSKMLLFIHTRSFLGPPYKWEMFEGNLVAQKCFDPRSDSQRWGQVVEDDCEVCLFCFLKTTARFVMITGIKMIILILS